jgi:hypothetical protein
LTIRAPDGAGRASLEGDPFLVDVRHGDRTGLDFIDGLAALDGAQAWLPVAAANWAAACSRTGATGMYSDVTDLLR